MYLYLADSVKYFSFQKFKFPAVTNGFRPNRHSHGEEGSTDRQTNELLVLVFSSRTVAYVILFIS